MALDKLDSIKEVHKNQENTPGANDDKAAVDSKGKLTVKKFMLKVKPT